MSRVGRPRHSEPSRLPPNLTLAPSPKHVNGLLGGWEYPLSREEKKHRVLCLYQAELEQVEKKNRGSSQGESKEHACKDCRALANRGGLFQRNVAIAGIMVMAVSIFLLVVMAVTIPALVSSAPENSPKDSRTSCSIRSPKDTISDELNVSDTSTLGLPPPNISDRISTLRIQGHVRLKISNCAEAEWWFSSALNLLSTSNNFSKVYRGALVGERGFALICAQSFEAGAEQLEQHLSDVGINQTLPHLPNALGYAYYNMQEFRKAIDMFDAVTKIEPLNPIVWNNLASANMVEGNLSSAENALSHAIYIVEHQPGLWPWYHEEIIRNVHNLQSRLDNLTSVTPNVELWNGYT